MNKLAALLVAAVAFVAMVGGCTQARDANLQAGTPIIIQLQNGPVDSENSRPAHAKAAKPGGTAQESKTGKRDYKIHDNEYNIDVGITGTSRDQEAKTGQKEQTASPDIKGADEVNVSGAQAP